MTAIIVICAMVVLLVACPKNSLFLLFMQQIRPLFGCLAEWFVLWLWGVCCFGAEAREKAANDSKRLNCVKFHRAKVGYKEKGLHLQHLHAGEFSAWKAERGRVGIYIQIKAYHALCFFDRPRSPEKISKSHLSKTKQRWRRVGGLYHLLYILWACMGRSSSCSCLWLGTWLTQSERQGVDEVCLYNRPAWSSELLVSTDGGNSQDALDREASNEWASRFFISMYGFTI